MQWIDEKALETWAARLDARDKVMAMLADLIRMTIDDASRFRFPSGDVGQLRGWDGDLETKEAKGFVPEGKSKWEFGTGPGEAKATKDYNKRTEQTADAVLAENTLILVNLESWDTPRKKITDWEDDRRQEGKWKDVKYLDGVSIVQWLKNHPAVAARYARDVLENAPQNGALSTDEYWEEFSTQFKPAVTEKLVIADREREADEIIAKLSGPADSFMLGAETSEEVVAFAVAAIRSAPLDVRNSLECRTLIVRTQAAARFFELQKGLVFIATGDAESLAGVLGKNCPTLSVATGAQAKRGAVLKRPTAPGMVDGFIGMGLSHEEGYELAHRCGRSLTILKRLRPNTPPANPVWVQQVFALKPAFLAGGWSSDLEMDCNILHELGDYASYAALESTLMPTLSLPDRPIDKEADVWQVRAPVDAFFFYGSQLTDADLTRLKNAIVKVFGKQPEQPSREQKFNLANAAPTDYSHWLRDGLALTLLIIASMHDVANLHVKGKTPQQYVDDVIQTLPEWGKSHHSLVRLGGQTATLAEASPNPFLQALESMLEGSPEQVAEIFATDSDPLFRRPSPHANFLWALETIAWDPRHLNRAAIILAKLAELDPDPDSNFSNRPINSLRSIFLGWSPNTYAPQPQRIACIDAILKNCPHIGWQLLKMLLPRYHDSNSRTHGTLLRDFSPEKPEVITFGSVWDFENAIVDRVLAAASDDEARLSVFIEALGMMQAQNQAKVLARMDSYLSDNQTAEGLKIWHDLKDELSRNEYFGDSDWALKNESLADLKNLVERYRPSDPLISDRHAFDDWMPHVGKYDPTSQSADDPAVLRAEALQRVLDRDDVAGILRLAKIVKMPDLVGQTVDQLSITIDQMRELMKGAMDHAAPQSLAHYVSAAGCAKFGSQWIEIFSDLVLTQVSDDAVKARLLLGWPATWATWSYVHGLNSDVIEHYWRNLGRLPIQSSMDEFLFAIDQLRSFGRHIDVLTFLHNRRKEISSELLLDLLSKGSAQLHEGVQRYGNMVAFYVAETLKELRTRSDVNKLDIAQMEYAYLPLLRHDRESLTSFALLSSDPQMFVDLLSTIYRGKDVPSDDVVTEETKALATRSYSLLSAFKTVPGSHGENIHFQELSDWVDQVRVLAAKKGIRDITDQRIGYLLAHAPDSANQQFWPPVAVCELIENVASLQVERGFAIECFNKRGVFSKAINEGGEQERDFVSRYKAWSVATVSYPRTSALLIRIADHWSEHADDEDTRAEQGKMKR